MNSLQLSLENTTVCEFQSQQKRAPEVRGLTHIDFSANRAGDIAEVYATAALMAKGATVFRNTGCDGKTDLCFKYKDLIYEIDVKIAHYAVDTRGNPCWRSCLVSKVMLPIYPLIVVPATGTDLSGWYCRWKKKNGRNTVYHCPPGLENFWD